MIFSRYLSSIFFNLFILIHSSSSSSSSSILLNHLRKDQTITFQSKLSSPQEMILSQDSQLNLTCSFLSNYQFIHLFWLHNGTLIQSFLSKSLSEDEEEKGYLGLSILSTLSISRIHFDMNGFYQCIAVHKEIYAQQTFHVHLHINKTLNLIPIQFSIHSFITVHTSIALFESRKSLTLMCRMSDNHQCRIEWFDRENQLMKNVDNGKDLILRNLTFEMNMDVYTCHICCQQQCQQFSSFIYLTAEDQ